jgi:hypothetical protein
MRSDNLSQEDLIGRIVASGSAVLADRGGAAGSAEKLTSEHGASTGPERAQKRSQRQAYTQVRLADRSSPPPTPSLAIRQGLEAIIRGSRGAH